MTVAPSVSRNKVAYVMSRFPKLTETFVLNEILAMERLGVQVAIFPLLREPLRVVHDDAMRLAAKAHYTPFISGPILRSNLTSLKRAPRRYLGLAWEVLRSATGSANFLAGAAGIFLKCVYFAENMRRLGITHVHAHFANHPAVAALIVGRLTGIPFSFTAHGSDLHVDRHMLREKVAAAAFVVTISRYNKELIVSECGEAVRDKIVVIHCGVDPDDFSPSSDEEPSPPLRIVCVASYEEVKGHSYLVSACRILRDRGLQYECHLVGDGPLRGSVEGQIRRDGLGAVFRVHGAMRRPDIQRLLRQAHVAALPSVPTRSGKREGIPVALMEAMAAGLPVVASRLSGIPELVEHSKSGLLVAPRDASSIAEAIELLARSPELRARMGKAGRQRVLHEFNLQNNAELLLGRIRASAASVSAPDRTPAHVGTVSALDPESGKVTRAI